MRALRSWVQIWRSIENFESLLECIFELYIDPQAKAPLPHDLSNESSVYLRNALLLALSTIRSQNGHMPWQVVHTLFSFAEHFEGGSCWPESDRDADTEAYTDCSSEPIH